MKNPFKSKYYYAIIDKIAELENEKAELINENGRPALYLQHGCFVPGTYRIAEIESKIKVLRGLL